MILAVSRFRVRGEDATRVREAFLNRPQLVERALGFQGMEVFNDREDPNLFCLVTRWSDFESFRAWHASQSHAIAHKGIPKGIRLDAAYTKLDVLCRIEGSSGPVLAARLFDWVLLIGKHLMDAESVFVLFELPGGRIVDCNEALAALTGRERGSLLGCSLWEHVTAADQQALKLAAAASERALDRRIRVNFVDVSDSPHTVLCHMEVQAGVMALLGDFDRPRDDAQERFLVLNNELASLNRENARQREELARANAALRSTIDSLAAERELLGSVLAQMPLGVAVIDSSSGRIVSANAKIGGTRKQLAALASLPSPQNRERGVEMGGAAGWVLESAAPVRNSEGRVIAHVVTQTDITGRVDAERHLQTLTESLKALAASLIRMRDSERRALQRALQEGVAQVATVAGWRLAAVPGSSDNKILKEAAQLIRSCCVDIREIASHLHPTVLDELGLAGALSDWTKGYQKAAGMSVQLDVAPGLGRMPAAFELNVFRIIEESVLGIAMLGAQRAIVSVERLRAACRITVESGAQPDLPLGEPGVHLAAIESRTQELGGVLNWGWSVKWIHIEVTLPLRAQRKVRSRRDG